MHLHVSYSLNFLKGGIEGILQGTVVGLIKAVTRSLDNGSCIPIYLRRTPPPPCKSGIIRIQEDPNIIPIIPYNLP